MKISRKYSKKRSGKLKKTAKRLAAYSAAAAATVAAEDRSANADAVGWDIPDVTVGPASLESVVFNMTLGTAFTAAVGAGYNTPGAIRLMGYYAAYPHPYIYTPPYSANGAFLGSTPTASLLSFGDPIGPNQSFSRTVNATYPNYGYYANLGNWSAGQRGFVGIRFDLGANTHYGWADITRASAAQVTLHAFGYNDTPDAISFAGALPELTLEVNTVTGEIALLGQETQANDINFYEITSAGNSLDDENWFSLEDQDFDGNGPPDPNNPGNGWEESGDVGSHALAEGYLLGNSAIDANASVSLGMGYDVDVDAQDLEFRFRTAHRSILEGLVEYVTRFEADFDQDGDVDGDDFLLWQNGFGTPSGATKMDGDYDNDGDVDGDDFLGWQAEFGSAGEGAGSAAVPEPSSILLLAAGAAGMGIWRRRRAG